MTEQHDVKRADNSGVAIGVILIAIGILFLASQFLGAVLGQYLWPFFVIVPGAALVVWGLVSKNPAGEGLTIFGSIVTVTGLLLFYQNVSGHWASWAYAWALVAPGGPGLGQLLYGAAKGRNDLVASGWRTLRVGLIMFVVFGAFFELVLGISGFGMGRYAWPVFLIGLGLVLLVSNLFRQDRYGKD
jgi:hypothetical protein